MGHPSLLPPLPELAWRVLCTDALWAMAVTVLLFVYVVSPGVRMWREVERAVAKRRRRTPGPGASAVMNPVATRPARPMPVPDPKAWASPPRLRNRLTRPGPLSAGLACPRAKPEKVATT